MAKNIKLPEKKKTTTKDKLAQAAAEVAARKAEAQASAKRTISREQADNRSPASVNRENYLRSQGIDPVRERQEQRAQARRDAARMLIGAASRGASEAAQRAVQRPDGVRQAFTSMEVAAERGMPHQMARDAAPTEQMRQRLVADVNATGRLPAGYGWYGTGENAVAADQRGLVYKPLEGVTAGSRAATPAVYGIDPDSYLTHMHDYDAWEAERGNLPEAAKRAQKYLQPAIDAESDPVRKAALQEQLDTTMANAQYSPAEQRRRKKLEDKAIAATNALGEDIGQYAGRSDADYLRSYGQQYGIGQEGEAYGESYHAPLFQRKGSDAAEHADLMNKLRFGQQYGAIKPVDMLETGDTQMLQNLTDEEAAVYMGMAARYGADTAQAYWNAMKQEGQYGQKAYAVRDAALRDMAGSGLLGAAGSSALSVLTSPMSLAGTLYSVTQKLTGEEIDPYADQFMFGQMTGTLRDEVGRSITRQYGKGDGTDTFTSWLMKTGYNAAMSSADSLVAGRLSGGSALGGSVLLGSSGAGSVIQDAKLRGATDEQALALGGLSIVFETATEYLPMDTLLDTIDGRDIRTFRDVLGSALKGGLSEAPGEGLSELLSHVSDQALMGPMSNYNLNVAQYQQTGMSSEEAHTQANKDLMWDIFNAAATGFLSGEGSNLLAGSNALIYNRNTSELQTADRQLPTQPMVDPLAAAADALVAKQEQQAAAKAAVPEAQEDAEGVSRFDRPMAATMIDAEDGNGNVQVVGFETTQDGKNVVLHTVDEAGNRGTAMANELAFADETVQELMTADGAKNLSGEGLQSYLTGYTETVNGNSVAPSEYAQAYGMVYRRAAAGMDMAEVIRGSVIPQVMTQSAMQDAYAAGLGAGAHQQATTPLSSTKGTMNRSFTKGAWNRMTRQEQRVAAANMEVVNQLAKRMGATINIVDSIATADGQRANGRYNPQTGQIDIALDADAKAYAYVAMHELTHQLKAEHETSWSTFSGWVQEALTDKGQSFEKLVQYQMDSFGLSEADAAEEVICNTVPAILQDEGTLQKLYQQDKSLFEKVMDWVKSLIDDIKAAGKNLSQRSESWRQMGALEGDVGTLQGLYDVMESIMQSEVENTSDNSTVKASRKDREEGKHYDYSKPFVEQVKDLDAGNFPSDSALVISGTPDVLKKVGFGNLPLTMNQEHLLNRHKDTEHELSYEFLKQFPELVKNPVAAIISETNGEKSLVMILHAVINQKPYIAPVYISTNSRTNHAMIDSNNIATTFRKENAILKLLTNAIKNESNKKVGIYYWNKTEARSLFEESGVQFPGVSIQDGLIHSIFDAGSPVNAQFMEQTETRQFRKWFAGSKVVNPDGTPKIMYHGTATEFWAFDKKKANDLIGRRLGLGAGKGKFYLTEYKGSAQLAADSAQQTGRGTSPKVMELYVSAKKVMDRSEYDRRLKEAYKQYPNSDPGDSVYDYRQRDKAIAAVDKAITREGYDGVWDRESGEMFVYDSTQIKSATDNIGLFDKGNPDIRYSRSDYDTAYSAAIEQGNMDKASDLVAQAAEVSMPDSKLRTPNGKLRVVYHGTNSEDFTVFDPQYIGMSSGDTGFFGRGFYFAYSKGEASFYGRKRIIPAYLNLTNPFNFQENLHEYNGQRTFDYNASSAVALMNFADKFPKIAEKITIDVARKGESFKEIPIREFADEYKKVLSDTEFLYDEVDGEFGDKETVVLADPEIHEFEYGGEKHTFKDYGFQKRVAGKVDKLSISYDYLASRVYSSVDMPNFTRVLLDHNKEFTATLKEMGYDGVIQSEDGDEAVAFESSQIKSAEPVTYDDDGNVIPLSKRFQDDNPDIRYSMSDYDDTVREGENVLEELLTMTAAHRMTDAEAARVARRVLKAASSEMDLDEATQRIKSIFDYASRSGNKLDMQGLSSEATALAEDMLSQSKTLDMQHEEEVADLRYYLKHNQIALSTEQQKEAASLMGGSYGAYRQALFGRVNLRNSGSTLDGAVWEQLHETAPHLFPLDTTSGDQVRLLMEAAEYVQPVYRNENGLDAREAAQWLTHELFKGYMSLSGVQSAAKEQNRLGLKLHQYRQVAERFAKEHKAAFDEAYAKVTKDANVRIAMAADKAERRADKAISEAAADADLRVAKAQAGVDKRIADSKQQNLADMEAYRQAMREKARAWRSEFVTRHRDIERKNRYRAQILRETNQLLKKVEKPTDKQHVQDELTGALTAFLKSLDLGKRSRERSIGDRILRLRNVMQDAANGESARSFIVDSDMLETMRFMAEQLQGMDSLDQLTADQMEQVRNIIHCAVWTVNKADTAFANQKAIRISSAAGRFLQEAGERKDWKDRGTVGNWARDFLTVGQMDSMHFFDKLGGAAKEMYQSLRNGLDKKTIHRAEAMAYVEEAVSKIPAKVQKELFAGKKATATAYDLSGGTVELTKGQVMEIYCLNKREQARGHLYDESVGGIRVGDNDKARAVKVNEGDIEKLTDTLTAEEKALADALQQFMAKECAQWGNETSLHLYGYKKFGEKNYYPIRVDPDSVDSNISPEGQQDNLYAIANMGMTKALKEKAKNALYIGDIFDTFCRHVDNMATYNAYAAPIADLVRWYNYRPGDGSSVKKMIQAKWGKEAAEYIPRLIRDLNGEVNRSYSPKWTEKLTGVMKSSSVGRNVRVVIQQPTAILRAGDMIDYRFLVRGMSGLTGKGGRVKLKKAIELSKQHCPIALLKSMGFFETDMGKSLRAALFDNRSVGDKVKDEGMWLAGKMDEMTFGAIWRACEAETRKLKPELTVGSEAYYEAVGRRMSDIIDYTQVVDTPLHRTQLMRSGDGLTKMATSFMSEPSKSYNMLASAMQRLKDNRHDPVAKRKFCRTISAYALNAIINGAAQSLIDAVRNGEEEDFWEKWGKAMFGDWGSCKKVMDYVRTALDANVISGLNPLALIPYVKDVLSLIQGYDVSRTDTQSMEKLVQVGTNVVKLATGENKLSGWGWARQMATAVDSVTGQSFSNALRDTYGFANLLLKAVGLDPISEKTETASTSITYDNLYDALLDGNVKKWDRVSRKTEKTEKEIDSAMATHFAEDADERVVAAYTAKQNGKASEYARIRSEFVEEYGDVLGEGGNKRMEDIFDRSVANYSKEVDTTGETKSVSSNAYTYKEAASVVQGYANGTCSLEDIALVRSEMIADSTAQDPQKTVDTNILKQLKPLYIAAGPTERKRLGDVIKQVFGKDDKYLANWLKK